MKHACLGLNLTWRSDNGSVFKKRLHSQPTILCSKSTIQTLKEGVKYVWCFYCYLLTVNIFLTLCTVSVVDFEQIINVCLV